MQAYAFAFCLPKFALLKKVLKIFKKTLLSYQEPGEAH